MDTLENEVLRLKLENERLQKLKKKSPRKPLPTMTAQKMSKQLPDPPQTIVKNEQAEVKQNFQINFSVNIENTANSNNNQVSNTNVNTNVTTNTDNNTNVTVNTEEKQSIETRPKAKSKMRPYVPKMPKNKPLPRLAAGTAKTHRISSDSVISIKAPTMPDI